MEVEDWNVCHPVHADRQVIRDVSFTVRAGEVVGIAGLMGVGPDRVRHEPLRPQLRPRHHRHGHAERQADRHVARCVAAIDAGLAYVTEDRKAWG